MTNRLASKRLALPKAVTQQTADDKLPQHRPGEKFLKGPVPLRWLATAARQPGKALHVAIALWFLAGMKKTPTVILSGTVLTLLCVRRYSGYRGLVALEQAGLVLVDRHSGRSPVVTIVDVGDTD